MARSIDDWFANAWASEPDPASDRDDDGPVRQAGGGHGARTPARPGPCASTSAGADELPRRPVGAPRLPLPEQGRDEFGTGEIQAAIQRIRAQDPGIRARRLARRLRERGWPAIALSEVRTLLATTPPPRAGHHPSARPRIDRTVGPRRWPVRQRTLICRACGVAVSARGTCYCP